MATIRKMIQEDREITNGSEKIFANNVDSCLKNSNYVEGFVFVNDDRVIGYGMLAKSFSTEFGGECIWIEDIYLEEEYRGQGIGSYFIQFVKDTYSDKILRLEVEGDNKKAISTYEKNGFKRLPYMELVREV